MKYLVTLLALALFACAETSPSNSPEVLEERLANTDVIKTQAFFQRTLIIQDVPVKVVKADLYTENLKSTFLYLIEYKNKQMSFRISEDFKTVKHNLESRYLSLLKSNLSNVSDPVDLKIDEALDEYRVLNALSLERCKSTSIYSKIRSTILEPKTDIYFAVSGLSRFVNAPYMLKWNLAKKEFTGLVETSWEHRGLSETFQEEPLLLTPNSNIFDKNNQLITSDGFLFADYFQSLCSSRYRATVPKKPLSEYTVDDQFLPRFKKDFDDFASKLIEPFLENYQNAFLGPNGIQMDIPSGLSPALVREAKDTPLYIQQIEREIL